MNSNNDIPMEDNRNNRIGIMLNVMNQLMEDCQAHGILWRDLVKSAECLWGLRNNNADAWNCGNMKNKQATNVATSVLEKM